MNCQEVHRRLEAYLDGELNTERRLALEAHLPACPACLADLADRRTLHGWLDRLPPPALPATFTANLMRRIDAEERPGPLLLWPWLRHGWSLQQFLSLFYAAGTTATLAAAGIVLLQWDQGAALASTLSDRSLAYWTELRTVIHLTGGWFREIL